MSWPAFRIPTGPATSGPPPAQSYQRQAFDPLSSILDAAVSDERIRRNPCRDKSIRARTAVDAMFKPGRQPDASVG
jgi:hypothetical protein